MFKTIRTDRSRGSDVSGSTRLLQAFPTTSGPDRLAGPNWTDSSVLGSCCRGGVAMTVRCWFGTSDVTARQGRLGERREAGGARRGRWQVIDHSCFRWSDQSSCRPEFDREGTWWRHKQSAAPNADRTFGPVCDRAEPEPEPEPRETLKSRLNRLC